MIATVALNPALDKIYFVDEFEAGKMYRVREMIESAGGKGVNVARVTKTLGEDTAAIGFKGGAAGNWIETQLKKLGVRTRFVEVQGETRTNNNIIDRSRKTETEILETGPIISSIDMGRFLQIYKETLEYSKVVILSGGLPQGIPVDYYKTLIEVAKLYKLPVILDASGEALSEGMKAKPHMIKPNLRELENLAKRKLTKTGDIIEVCREIVISGIEVVTVSMGEEGAILVSDNICIRAIAPTVTAVNSIGSGDAMVAGFAVGLVENKSPEECLKLAMACGVSNTQFVEIGVVDKDNVEVQLDNIEIEILGS